MAEKVTITRIGVFTKDKEGNPLTTKQGKPYTRVLIDTADGRKMSGFGNQTTSNWKEGDEVEVEVTESNGYLNFRVPKQPTSAESVALERVLKTHIDRKFEALKADLKVIADHLGVEAPPKKVGNTGIDYPESDVEVPFNNEPSVSLNQTKEVINLDEI